ncbi:hypothetical protein [Ulvibacterium sp.]|uniref:hypothetical protein n=1 Tax=Ulvibacterium sp. TaxID=2665914 RepID=UPI003BAA6A2A
MNNQNSLYSILFLLLANFAFAQSDEIKKLLEPKETDSLFILAIENYTKELDGLESKTIYVQYENYLSRLPKTINGFEIIKLGLANRKKYFRKNKNRLTLVEISPLTIENGLFNITLILYAAKLKGKRKLELSYSHFHRTYFKCLNGRLIMDKTEGGGI